jgi:hypothetical protein
VIYVRPHVRLQRRDDEVDDGLEGLMFLLIGEHPETLETVHRWLSERLEPFFVGSAGTFDYDGSLSLFESTG